MDLDRNAVMPTFLTESDEGLGELEQGLLNLDRACRQGEEAIAQVFRVTHTLKGNAESLGFDGIGRCAHALENVLDALRRRAIAATPGLVNVLLAGHDALRSMLSVAAEHGTPELTAHEEAMRALADAAAGDIGAKHDEALRMASDATTDIASRKSLRVDLPTLDRIMTHTEELSIALSRLRTAIDGRGDVFDAVHEIERLFGDLREQAMRLRLVPIGPLFRQQLRWVRDLAVTHGKLARLVIEGEDIEVDAAVRDGLRDPVTHMIRNALDHAIEKPEVRRAAGKEPFGTITLRAMHAAGSVIVEVSDDGAGFHRGRILERARALGLLDDKTAIADEDLFRCVLVPGFSTATAVTDLSGRGVGMDVVAQNVHALKGSICIRSTQGEGSLVTLRVPLTVAIIDGFAVKGARETFVIPMESVRECVAFEAQQRHERAGFSVGVLNLRGEPLPYVRLRSLLGLPCRPGPGESVVVIEHDGTRAGLAVDKLLGQMQAVVRPLAEGLQAADWVAGATFLGDGRVALILEVSAILRAAARGGLS